MIIGGMGEKRMYCLFDGLVIGGYLVDGLLNSVYEWKILIFVNIDVIDIKKNGEIVNEVIVYV